jgi:hypothetical protein
MLLELGHIYHWSVSAVDLGSNNVVASASSYVERVEALTLHPVDPMERPKGASELGLWFDALAPLFQLTLSGQAQLIEASLFSQLASSANLPTAAAE